MVHYEWYLGMHIAGFPDTLLIHTAKAKLLDKASYCNHLRHRKWLSTPFDLGLDHLGLKRSRWQVSAERLRRPRAPRRHDNSIVHAFAAPPFHRSVHHYLRSSSSDLLVEKQASTDRKR